ARLRRPIPFPIPVAIPASSRLAPPRLGLGVERAATLPLLQNLAAIHPRLDPDDTIGGVRFRKSVVDIGPQRMQRKLPLQVPLAARDFGAIQAPRHTHLDSLAPEPQRRV